jgi:hypothetical protein
MKFFFFPYLHFEFCSFTYAQDARVVKHVELSNIETTTALKHGEIQNRMNLKTLDLEVVQR